MENFSMKAKFKILAVAVAMATGGMLAAGTAQAALISTGGYNPNNGPDGTGSAAGGNVIFSIYDPTAGQSLILNTQKTVLDMFTATSFSISDAGLASFISSHSADLSVMQWNMGGLANGPALTGVATTNGNAGVVWNPAMTPGSGLDLAGAMDGIYNYATNNNTFLSASNSYASPSSSATGFIGSNAWGYTFGSGAAWGAGFNNSLTGLNGGMKMSFAAIDLPTDGVSMSTFAGTWSVDAAAGTLNYTAGVSAVPVPAAVWLFGSGLLGLVGISRRKKV
jgi:hypothetical protein